MNGQRDPRHVMPVRFRGRAGGLCLAVLLVAGCLSTVTPVPSSSARPEASSPTATASPQASVAPSRFAADIRLAPGGVEPLDDAIVRSLVSTPTGFALAGDSAVSGDRSGFILSGSSDAKSWTRLDSDPAGIVFSSVAGGPLGWVAASNQTFASGNGTVLWFSTDGTAWDRLPDQAGLAAATIASSESDPLVAGAAGFAAVGEVVEDGSSVPVVWTSHDGRTWTEATALRDKDVEQVVALPAGFLSISGGCCAGPDGVRFSIDGRVWRDVSSQAGSPYAPGNGSAVTTALLGSRLVALRSGPQGVLEVYRGDVAGLAPGGPIAWQQDADADAAFTGAGISAVAAGAASVLVLGFDRATLDPISWTSRDGRTWTRTALDATTFGGGVPGLAAVSGSAAGSSFAAVGFRANAAADVRSQVWRSDDGAAWSAADGDVLGVPPIAATGPCPTTVPTRIDDYLLLAPPLWPVCFADQTLKVRGFVSSCECGGTTSQQANPAWLIDPLGLSSFYLGPAIVQAATGRGGFGVMIDPAHPVAVPEVGQHVELTGHFADPAAASCRVWPNDEAFGPVVPRAQTVALCRQAFVVTGIRRLS